MILHRWLLLRIVLLRRSLAICLEIILSEAGLGSEREGRGVREAAVVGSPAGDNLLEAGNGPGVALGCSNRSETLSKSSPTGLPGFEIRNEQRADVCDAGRTGKW